MFSINAIRKMNDARPRVSCAHCEGRGTVPLGVKHNETLELLRKQTDLVNGAQLAKLAKCSNEAMCNRLVELEEYGFATSARYGRERLWQVVKNA
jgi:hypothetical protein